MNDKKILLLLAAFFIFLAFYMPETTDRKYILSFSEIDTLIKKSKEVDKTSIKKLRAYYEKMQEETNLYYLDCFIYKHQIKDITINKRDWLNCPRDPIEQLIL